jgi:hypothetical protein
MAETARLLEQQRIASKKYYDSKREIISQRRKERRQLLRQVTDAPQFNAIEAKITTIDSLVDEVKQLRLEVEALKHQPFHPSNIDYAQEPFMDDHYDDARGSAPHTRLGGAEPAFGASPQQEGVIGETSVSLSSSTTEKVYPPTLEGIKQFFIDNNQKSHKNAINQFFSLIGVTNLSSFANYEDVIDTLKSSEFAVNTRITYLAALLKACSSYEPFKQMIGIAAYREYDRQLQILKLESSEEYKKKQSSRKDAVYNFDQYFDLIREKFGTESKEFIAILVFSIQTLRDNFDFVVTPDRPTDKNKNWIWVPRPAPEASGLQPLEPVPNTSSFTTPNLTLFLNNYKTSKKFDKFEVINEIPINEVDSNLIRNYINRNRIQYGQYLFGSKSLGKFIAVMNRNIDLDLTINDLRKMKESTQYKNLGRNVSNEDIVRIAHEARHNVGTSVNKYKRQVKSFPKPKKASTKN